MSRRRRTLPAFLVFAGAVELACAPEDVIVLRLPAPNAGAAGAALGGTAGVAGSESSAGAGTASGGFAGTDAAGNGGNTAGADGGTPNQPQSGAGGSESAGTAGVSGMSGNAGAGDSEDCRNNEDCPPSRVCVKSDCGAERGVCEPEPLFCESTPAPVCGCDDVTYWNDCVRRSAGVAASTLGECRAGAVDCNDAGDCGVEDAVCARLRPRASIDMCPAGPGTCWVLPKGQCDPGDPRRWIECVPQGAPLPPFPPPCIDTCTALRSGVPHFLAHPDFPCP